MALTFTSTRLGSSSDYMRYVFGEESGLEKTDRYMDSTLLDFALVPSDSGYFHLNRGSYITIDSVTYPKWFTGFITNEAECTFLGTQYGEPVFGYKYHATSDEYILSLKPIGVINPFLNMKMGDILKTLVFRLLPPNATGIGYAFDVTGIQDGPLVAQYAVTPDKTFKDVFKDLCDQASYLFYANDLKLYFRPQDDPGLGSLILDGSSRDYTPARLDIKPSQTPILNDVTVLGKLEPQTYMHEYYVGTGLTGTFPLTAGVWGADNCVLLSDTFDGTEVDGTKWTVFIGGVPMINSPQGTFSTFDNYLQVNGDGWIQSVSAIPMDSKLRFTHGEFHFLAASHGVIGALYTGNTVSTPGFIDFTSNSLARMPLPLPFPMPSRLGAGISSGGGNAGDGNLLYGISVGGLQLNPVVNGTIDTTQSLTINTEYRYVIRTIADFKKSIRVPFEFTYLDSTGTLQSVTSLESQEDTVAWDTIITAVDPTNGSVVSTTQFHNLSVLNGVTDVFAIYTLVNSIDMNLTVGGTSISIPINCVLETATAVRIYNGSFNDWDSPTQPTGWYNATNVSQAFLPIGSGYGCQFGDAGTVDQNVSKLFFPGYYYNVVFRASGVGGVHVRLYGTGVDFDQVWQVPDTTVGVTGGTNAFGVLVTTPLTSIPDDLTLRVAAENGVIVDSLTVLSTWQRQLVGPNEMDAMDGLAPVATIVAGNANSQTKSVYMGAPQYNPGQDQLAFFKNSVTLTSTVPPEGQVFRLSYRAAGSAIGRVRDAASVIVEQGLWLDDGTRSIVRTDLAPLPRTSLECQLAAKAIVNENSFQHYEGTYTQFSPYFAQEPKSGMPLKFISVAGIPFITAEEINEVKSKPLTDHVILPPSESPAELFEHAITFGKPDHVRRLLSRMQTPIDTYQQTPATPYAAPAYVDVTEVGLPALYEPDVLNITLMNWDDSYAYFDLGTFPSANGCEVRYLDMGWGTDSGLLVPLLTDRYFAIPRSHRSRVFFIRNRGTRPPHVTADGTLSQGPYSTSRFSTCVTVQFPVVKHNDYVRDWGCRLIDTASPLVTGTDLASNRYTVVVPPGDYVELSIWTGTLKTLGDTTVDMLRSTDGGVTYTSLFPDAKPVISGTTATGTAFYGRFLENGDMIRYDNLASDGTAGGLELVLQGRVFTGGDVPLNVENFAGTTLPAV